MEKVITAVVTTLLCSIFSGEGQKSEVPREEVKKTTQVESFDEQRPSKVKDAVAFDSIKTAKKID